MTHAGGTERLAPDRLRGRVHPAHCGQVLISAATQPKQSGRNAGGLAFGSATAPPYGDSVRDVFHISLPADWEQAQRDGAVTDSARGVTLADEGFVHCSFAEQLAATAARFYGDLDEIVLLRIDPAGLTSPLVVEDVHGTGEAFPHVYGPIDLTAVVEARLVRPSDASA
jgi:uncharacterized protein (DUF952 family)